MSIARDWSMLGDVPPESETPRRDALVVTLRAPRLDDHEAWRASRDESRASIEPWWFATDGTWEEQHEFRAWARGVLDHRRLVRRGSMVSWVVDVEGRARGQVEVTGIDRVGGSAEIGIWIADSLAGQGVGTAVTAAAIAHVFTELGLRRVVAPVAVGNAPTEHVARSLGLQREAVMRRYLEVGHGLLDHALWTMHRDDDAAERLLAARSADGRVDVRIAPGGDRPLAAASRDVTVAHPTSASRSRIVLEVGRYTASVLRARGRAAATTAAAVAATATPALLGELVELRPLGGSDAWELSAGGGSRGVVALHDHDPDHASVGLTIPTRSAPAPDLAEAVTLVADHAVETLGVRRTWVVLPVPTAAALEPVLDASGFEREGVVRDPAGEPQALWARTVEPSAPDTAPDAGIRET